MTPGSVHERYEFRERSVAQLVKESLAVLRRHADVVLVPVAIVFGIIEIPAFLLAAGRGIDWGDPQAASRARAVLQVASYAATLCSVPVVTFAVGEVCARRRPRAQDVLLGGLRSLGRWLWTVILAGTAFALGLLLVVVPGVLLRGLGIPLGVLLLCGAVLVLLLVALVTACSLVLGPLCVFERVAGPRAIRRNLQLTKGQLGRGMGLLFLGGMLTSAFLAATVLALGWLPIVGPMAVIGAQAAAAAFSAALVSLLYLDIRTRREALDFDAWSRPPALERDTVRLG